MVFEGRPTTSPCVCPGYLMNIGTAAMSPTFAGSTGRSSPPGLKLTPWSATTTRSVSSYRPVRSRRSNSFPSIESA